MTAALPFEVDAGAHQPLGMTPAEFLRDYWQKRPLLIRNAFPGFESPLEPEDLAGLACEELALSRLIQHNAEGTQWQVEHGPFPEEKFPGLGEQNWTLLVQDVDKWDAEVAALLDAFAFLPRWRIDDIMISFAATGGNVGAHVDHYDVFLLQGLGQRRWEIDASMAMNGTLPDLAFRDDVELKLLRQFNATHAWTLNPGDMLYLPPEVPHHGVALNPCLTYSVGMRAPSQADLIGDFADRLTIELGEEHRYTDPDLQPPTDPREIDAAALHRVRQAMKALLESPDGALEDWFGRFITAYRNPGDIVPSEEQPDRTAIDIALGGGLRLQRHPWSNMAWRQVSADQAQLFFNGEALTIHPAGAARLAGLQTLDRRTWSELPADAQQAVVQLFAAGQYVLERS